MKIKYIISLLFVSCFSFGQAQELEEIIEKHIDAHGGAEKWNAIENMKITAQFTAFSEVDDWMAIISRDGKYFSELSLGKFDVIEAFDGQNGWTIDPWMDITYPRLLNEAEENVFFQKAEWMTPFFNYKEKGLALEYLGEEDLEGKAVYAIKVTRPSGNIETWYLSMDSYLEYKRVSMWVDFTYPSEAETYFEDFREVDGVILPFYVEKSFSQRNRVLEIQKVAFNVPLDQKIFEMPPSKEMEKLHFLLGDWNVKVDIWSGRRNQWFPLGETTSHFQLSSTNLIEENIRFTVNLVQPIKQFISFHQADGKYRLARYNASRSQMEIFAGDFSEEAFTVDNTMVQLGNQIENKVYSKIIITKIDEDHFTLEMKNSDKPEEKWNDGLKLNYSRQL